ncbi:MAG: hypothetical protein HY260_17785, partial [Chloroflexi bacterium]|nr:hypothetical protein [Chloroflexota bacterium]
QEGSPVWIAGFAQGRAATGMHDDLWVRCLALSAGARPVAVCGVDVIGLFWDDVAKVREGVKAKLGKDADVIVASTHVHEGPDTMGLWGPKMGVSGIDDTYNAFVVKSAVDAAAEAISTLRPATLRAVKVTPADVAGYYDDSRPPFVHDPEIVALAFDGMDRQRIATLVNWSNHPEAQGSQNTLISADWPAGLYARLEQLEGGTVVFVNGAVGGMQSPLGAKIVDPRTKQPAPKDSFRFAEVVGEYVADHIHAGWGETRATLNIDEILYREAMVKIPVTNPGFELAAQANLYKGRKAVLADKTNTSPVGYLRLSAAGKPQVEVALIPGEMYPELSVGGVVADDPGADFPGAPVEPAIKKMMAAPYRMLLGLANDEIGYIIPKAQWDEKPPYTFGAQKRWYGEVNSVGPDAAPEIAKAFQALVRAR